MVIYSDPGLITSSIKNPTKSSESVSVHCERNMIVHLDLDEKLQDTAMPSPSDFSVSYLYFCLL